MKLDNMPRRPDRAGTHEFTFVLVLLLTLGLTAVLTYQAQHAARSHRDAAEATLRDYAAFASWELARNLEERLATPLDAAVLHARMLTELALLTREVAAHDAAALARFRDAVRGDLQECGCSAAAHDFFVLDVATGDVVTTDARLPVDFDFEDWLRSELAADVRRSATWGEATTAPPAAGPITIRTRPAGGTTDSMPSPGLTLIRRNSRPTLSDVFTVRLLPGRDAARIVYAPVRGAPGPTTALYGFALDVVEYARPIVRSAVDSADLLPPSLMRGRRNSAVLDVDVSVLEQQALHGTGHPAARLAQVRDTVETMVGPLATAVSVRPEMAGTLLIGGLPRSRLPLLLALFAINLILIAAGALLLRRQHALTRLRSDFVSSVSHELRTPLAQISLFAELLDSGRLDHTQRRQSVRIINEEAQRLRHLVDNVLEFASRGPRRGSAAAAVDLGVVIADTIDSFAPLARSRGTRVSADIGADLMASVDPHAVRQILLNLLDNAVKYGPSGQLVRVRARRVSHAVRIEVDDQGRGIPAASRAEVWKPYTRLPRDIATSTAGSGIGLAVVSQLVRLHGGTVGIEDAPGGGARFTVDLPIAMQGAADTDAGDGADRLPAGAALA